MWAMQRMAAGTRKLEAAEEGGFPSPEAVAARLHMNLAAWLVCRGVEACMQMPTSMPWVHIGSKTCCAHGSSQKRRKSGLGTRAFGWAGQEHSSGACTAARA